MVKLILVDGTTYVGDEYEVLPWGLSMVVTHAGTPLRDVVDMYTVLIPAHRITEVHVDISLEELKKSA